MLHVCMYHLAHASDVTSLYWSFMTMTTVGYGDISAQTPNEKWVAICSMLAGGFVFGLVIGGLSDLSRRSNPGQKEVNKRIGWLYVPIPCIAAVHVR